MYIYVLYVLNMSFYSQYVLPDVIADGLQKLMGFLINLNLLVYSSISFSLSDKEFSSTILVFKFFSTVCTLFLPLTAFCDFSCQFSLNKTFVLLQKCAS